MADCTAVLCRIRQLPCELRLLIRSYAYFVDFERLEALRQKWAYIENHGLPPLWALLEEPSYLKTRERFVDDAPPNCWPERVEKAFHTGNDILCFLLRLFDLPYTAIPKDPIGSSTRIVGLTRHSNPQNPIESSTDFWPDAPPLFRIYL